GYHRILLPGPDQEGRDRAVERQGDLGGAAPERPLPVLLAAPGSRPARNAELRRANEPPAPAGERLEHRDARAERHAHSDHQDRRQLPEPPPPTPLEDSLSVGEHDGGAERDQTED